MNAHLHSIERLESRIAPANAVAVNLATKTATWTDWDGDLVTLKWTGANAPTFVTEDTGGLTLFVDKITLTNANDAITVSVKNLGAGDGHIDLGHVDATGIALKSWSSPKATVSEFDCGDNTNAIGTYVSAGIGIVPYTKFAGSAGDGTNSIKGNVGSFTVRGDVGAGILNINAGAAGKIGSINIAGSIRGDMPVAGIVSGNVAAIAAKLGSFILGGSIIGGNEGNEGEVLLQTPVDTVLVKGSVLGGTASFTGELTMQAVKTFTIRGSIVGGTEEGSGIVGANSVAGFTLGGNLVAGRNSSSGTLTFNSAKNILIKGDIMGSVDLTVASNNASGALIIKNSAGNIVVNGDLIAGTQDTADTMSYNGAILIKENAASITVKGNILGNNDTRAYVLAGGLAPAAFGNYNAIGKLSVGGDVEHAYIAAGQLANAGAFSDRIGNAENSDAGIGSVTVGGNWLHSNLTAGINDSGSGGFDSTDTRSAGTAAQAVIGPVVIKGDLLDDPTAFGFSGFGAEKIASITVGGVKIFTSGAADRFLDFFKFVRVGEV